MKLHDFIWLQPHMYPEVSWCEDKIEDTDIAYVRVDHLIAPGGALDAAWWATWDDDAAIAGALVHIRKALAKRLGASNALALSLLAEGLMMTIWTYRVQKTLRDGRKVNRLHIANSLEQLDRERDEYQEAGYKVVLVRVTNSSSGG